MSWNAAAADLHRTVMDVFGGESPGSYLPAAGGPAFDVRVVVDRDVGEVGEYGQISGRTALLKFHRDDVQVPRQGDQVTVNGTVFEIERREADDGYIVAAVAHPVVS